MWANTWRAVVTVLAAWVVCSDVNASTIVASGGSPNLDPSLGAETIVDFETGLPGDVEFKSATFGHLILSGIGGGQALRYDGSFSGSFNTFGNFYIHNDSGNTPQILFEFRRPMAAFAFNFGATDVEWELQAFSKGVLLEALLIPPTGTSNMGDYFGIVAPAIDRATLTITTRERNDAVFIDNVTFVQSAQPEPSAWATMTIGFGAVGASVRRRRRHEAMFGAAGSLSTRV